MVNTYILIEILIVFILGDANATGIPFESDTRFISISHHILSAFETTFYEYKIIIIYLAGEVMYNEIISSDLEKYFRLVYLKY
jgi:hypothetical protein